ncbi:MAG TPA: Wzz/FepE/Etk N-terminal domain-containing protein [Acetobacteraceae bacterium]|jgi:uncharacterized protein involved in exopolysaccharide biosynthesis|nr:Wzz/FepE/Etk N-terminal domain-containing protein [Acetobacteraceae bacterium]
MNVIETIDPRHEQPGSGRTLAAPPLSNRDADERPRRGSLRDALSLVFYHRRLIRNCIVFGLLVGIAGALLSKPRFDANALVLVLIGPDAMSAQAAAGISQAVVSIDGLKVVQSEIQIIQSERVLRSAVQQVGPSVIYPRLAWRRFLGLAAPRPPATQLGEAVQRLRGDLHVDAEPGSNVVRISFAHPDRAVAIQVVQDVLDAYLTQRQTAYTGGSADFLTQEIDRYRKLLRDLDTEIQGVRTRYDVLDLPQDEVLAIDRLDGVVQRQNQVRERRVAVQTEIVAVQANLATQPQTVLDFRESTNNTGNDEARNTLVRLEQQLTYLQSQFQPRWPQIAEVEKKIATARGEMGRKAGTLYYSERNIRNPAIDLLQNRLASLEVEDQALNKQLVELDDQNKQAAQRVALLREAEGQLHSLQLTRDVSEGVYRQLAQKQPAALLQDRLSSDPNASLRVVQPATAPVIGRSLAISYIFGGTFLGLLLGAAAAAVATMLRQVYLAPAEAERELALPALAIFDSPVREAELEHHAAIARLGALLQEASIDDRPLSSLQIMGLTPGDDRTALVRALATELANGFQRDTLILDLEGDGAVFAAELGRPADAVPPITGLPVQVAATRVPRLWISVGPVHSALSDWRSSIVQTRAALDELRQRFGMVLLIAPADVAGHAVHRLAVMVDGNIVILRAEQTRGPVAQRLRDAILTTGGNMLGFIFVNRKYYVPAWLLRWV